MGNALGNFKEYMDAFESSPRMVGGAIWDFVDQSLRANPAGNGIYKPAPFKGVTQAYGGMFGDRPNPVYLATARIWDEEFRKRVIHHQERRGPEWTNIEEDKELSRHSLSGRTVLIDCITLWCTNFFFDLDADTDRSLAAAKAEFDRFTAQDATFIFVTNEIGMGGTSENEIQRKFTDMQGWMNQYVASRADEVILMVSGIATKIKCE